MERPCLKCSDVFRIHPDEEAFINRMQFTFGKTTVKPPLPVHCPDCRSQIRACHRNENTLYKNRSAFSGKDIVSIHHETPPWGKPYTVYEQEEWKSESFDPMQYGRDIDFGRPFFEQFAALHKDVPRLNVISLGNENSGFTTGTGYCKNCYLINSSENCEDCYYGKLFQDCTNCVDCSYVYNCELCYECFSLHKSYNCMWVSVSSNCTDCLFSSGLQGCKNCCLCTNLVNKEYHFLNEPLSKEKYEQRLDAFRGSYERTQQMKQRYAEQMSTMIRKYGNISNSEHCTGDYIDGSKDCIDCYDVNDSEDCRYVQVGVHVKDIYDCSNMYLKPELCYQIMGSIEAYNSAFCLFIFHSKNMLYSEYCFQCSDCFGCNGLTRKQFCIFNKQYTKEEYDSLVPKMIDHMKKTGEWGRFFPPSMAPFAYNESLAYEYFPLTKEEALAQGFSWREHDVRDFKPATATVPERITDAPNTMTQEILSCEETGKNYRIIPQELGFYQTQNIPLPRLCPEIRYRNRLQLRNPRTLYERTCNKCGTSITTTYAPDRPETVYCEACYRASIYA